MVSQKSEDISYSDMGNKHGKPAEVFRFQLFMKHCCNIIQSKEEQNPLAVMRWPENGSFLLEQIKNWIADKSSGFNALKIISSLRQEPIYRSPGAGQQMAVTRYSISIHIEDHDAYYQGASKSQMLLWDGHAPPPKRVTSGGDWYIVFMEVFVDKIDHGGRRLDNRNPEAHVKVTLHVSNSRMASTPPDISPCDANLQAKTYMYNNAFNPCVLNYQADYTLSPEEFGQLVGPQKYFLPTEQQKDQIPTFNPCVLNYHADYTLRPEEFCQLDRPQKIFFRTEQPKKQIPNDCTFSKLATAFILMSLASTAAAIPVPQSNQVVIQILQDADYLIAPNCTLKMNEKLNATDLNWVKDFCYSQQNIMNTNLHSLKERHNSSVALQVNLIFKLDKDFNVTNVTSQYIFNGKELNEAEITNLPMLISGPRNDYSSIKLVMEKVKDYAKSSREEILPFKKKGDLPETTAPWVIAVSTVIPIVIILILLLLVLYRKYGMMSCKKFKETICKAAYRLVAQTEA